MLSIPNFYDKVSSNNVKNTRRISPHVLLLAEFTFLNNRDQSLTYMHSMTHVNIDFFL